MRTFPKTVLVTSRCCRCGEDVWSKINPEQFPTLNNAREAICRNCNAMSNWKPTGKAEGERGQEK